MDTVTPLEVVNEDWARQLSIYSWLLGNTVGAKFVAGIEQIVGYKQTDEPLRPLLRFASFRNNVSSKFQSDLYMEICQIWKQIMSGVIFDEDNDATCRKLDAYHDGFGDETPEDKEFTSLVRAQRNF